jgi:hypothetical protein
VACVRAAGWSHVHRSSSCLDRRSQALGSTTAQQPVTPRHSMRSWRPAPNQRAHSAEHTTGARQMGHVIAAAVHARAGLVNVRVIARACCHCHAHAAAARVATS